MKMSGGEVIHLIDQEIPEGRQHLQESYRNLENVAQYCTDNYLKASDKRSALEETKNYTTHSLASVAYQINSLATNFLKLLDLQQNQLAEMESNVNYLAQTVMIHKEKVARREIGVLTTNRSTNRPLGVKNGIIFPEQTERSVKYHRKPIDYTLLDEIGHGVRVVEQGFIKTQGTVSRGSRSSSISSNTSAQAPIARPPTPPQNRGSSAGSLSKATGSHYRTPAPPVAPPSVPSHYAPSNYSMGQITALPGQHTVSARRGSGGMGSHISGPMMHGSMDQPPVGISRPISQNAPPPPPPSAAIQGRISQMMHQHSIGSPDLPPPPPMQQTPPHLQTQSSMDTPPPPPQFTEMDEDDDSQPYIQHDDDPYAATGPNLAMPDWIPPTYLEKVIAIYDYQADKEDELSFSENAVIYVVKKNDDGWWEGVMDGCTGLFPGNYVEPCI
ncbi:hypothetical protein KUTeg_015377 [Tegillarca granosa]|uniref:SH3 domain-containing protein n=1 Tax=Tegillarca granosa TaxID=220873 RepID=A0ABQ9EPZ3_TEGGR|nr:hypothetical protein KUTeg_015377 [Tegillarca granosa]